MEKIILPYITSNITNKTYQHAYKKQHSTTTVLHKISNTIITGFNENKPPKRTISVALDMSKAFDTVNHYTLLQKLLFTQIPNTITKYVANYIRGRTGFTRYKNVDSKQKTFKTGVPQGGVLSPVLFNIYTSDLPQPPPNTTITMYADDLTIQTTKQDIKTSRTRPKPIP